MSNDVIWLTCACCGHGFQGWQHWDRDDEYGICDNRFCATAYGYHTVGPRPTNEGYAALVKEIDSLRNK